MQKTAEYILHFFICQPKFASFFLLIWLQLPSTLEMGYAVKWVACLNLTLFFVLSSVTKNTSPSHCIYYTASLRIYFDLDRVINLAFCDVYIHSTAHLIKTIAKYYVTSHGHLIESYISIHLDDHSFSKKKQTYCIWKLFLKDIKKCFLVVTPMSALENFHSLTWTLIFFLGLLSPSSHWSKVDIEPFNIKSCPHNEPSANRYRMRHLCLLKCRWKLFTSFKASFNFPSAD